MEWVVTKTEAYIHNTNFDMRITRLVLLLHRPEVDIAAREFFAHFCPQRLMFTKTKREFTRKLVLFTVVPALLTGCSRSGVCVCQPGLFT